MADKDVYLAAVTHGGSAIQHLSAELKADKEIGPAAVPQDGCAIQHLSADLTADEETALQP